MEVLASSAVLVAAVWLVVMSTDWFAVLAAAAVGQVALVAFVAVAQAGGVVVEAGRTPVVVEENLHAERRLTCHNKWGAGLSQFKISSLSRRNFVELMTTFCT